MKPPAGPWGRPGGLRRRLSPSSPWGYARTLSFVVAGALAAASVGGARAHASPAASEPHRSSTIDFILGTWTGTSTCVGPRGACKDETVVYRFVTFEGHPGQVRLLADKILDGKRVPMGALVFDVDPRSKTVRCEFARGQTHGVWSFTVAGDAMTGTLTLLPDRSRRRDVEAHRANEQDVPKAPPLVDYDD